jgi:hypothetical protein
MNKKKYMTISLIAFFTLFVFSAPALAGSPRQHRLEGVAIGVGAVILGSAIVTALNQSHNAPVPQQASVEYHHHYKRPKPRPAGHWEMRKDWVPPTYKKVWNPGHYNRHGHWVAGHWMRIEVEPGHWAKRKVWVSHR